MPERTDRAPLSERAKRYATNVVAGRILACEYVRKACKRHLDDLESAESDPDYPYYFDAAAADELGRFVELLPHVKGKWAKDGERLVLEPWQCFAVGVPFGWKRRDDHTRRFRRAYLEIPRKNGKALALDTPIPTAEGWSTMGDLRVGDAVFDEEGRPCVVVAATSEQHERPCYRVTFSDDTSVVADAEHEWVTDARRDRDRLKGVGGKNAGPKPSVKTTREIADTLMCRQERNHRIPCAGPLELQERELPIPPYVLGVWLGDGTSSAAAFTTAYDDSEIVEAVAAEGVPAVERASSNENSGIYSLSPRGGDNAVGEALRDADLLNNKHIPAVYLRASFGQRLSLLQGLMDTDGTISKAGQCEFSTTTPELRDGFVELARTLGLKPSVKTDRATLYGQDHGEVYRIQFWPFDDMPAFRLTRKTERQKPAPSRRPRSGYRQIVGVEEVEAVPVRCIQVSSPSSLFLAGEGMVPTHNSSLTAALGLYMFAADGEFGAEVYSGAGSEKQAWEVFGPARLMAKRTPQFQEHYGVQVNAKNLNILATNSKFEPIIGKPGDGASPSFSITDEYHEHDTEEQLDTMLTGMGSREEPMAWVITTAGTDTEGPCYALRSEAVETVNGLRDEGGDELFAVIYTIDDEDDDWTSVEALEKANPNIDVSVGRDYLLAQQRDAVHYPRKQSTFKTKHLNVWTAAASPFFNLEKWNRSADESLTVEQFAGEPCWIGLDLASKKDLAAAVKLFRREIDGEEHYYTFGRYYLPESRTEDPSLRHYGGWARGGCLVPTPGNITDYDAIEADLKDDSDRFRIVEIGFDPWNATQVVTHLIDHGVSCAEVPQNVRYMSEPMKWVDALIDDGRFHHDGNPVLAWAIGNVTAQVDRNDNVYPRKEREEKKIDPAVALIIAMSVALRAEEQASSPYESHGIRMVG